MIHANSKLAHAELTGDRHAAVLDLYRQNGPLTDRQAAKLLAGDNADPNVARPRITELIDAGLLYEIGNTIDATTGRKVRICNMKEAKQFCNCTFAGQLEKRPSKRRPGFVAVVCTSPVHTSPDNGKPLFYGYEVAQ